MKNDNMSKVKCEACIKQKCFPRDFIEISIAFAISFILLMVFIILLILGIRNEIVWFVLALTAIIFLVIFGFWLNDLIERVILNKTYIECHS